MPQSCRSMYHMHHTPACSHTRTITHSTHVLCTPASPAQKTNNPKQHTSQRENLADPDNYALAATGRLQLSDSTVLRATLQVGF
jgi:hypothetical protein